MRQDISSIPAARGTPDDALIFSEAGMTLAGRRLAASPLAAFAEKQNSSSETERVGVLLAVALNNPHRPLTYGLGVSLPDPQTGRRVVFDDCRDADGVMLEAKGPGFATLLRSQYLRDVIKDRWANQAIRQTRAAGKRAVEWYFAEPESKVFADTLFNLGDEDKIKRIITKHIITHYLPAVFP